MLDDIAAAGGGDVSSGLSTSVDSETLFSGTGRKTIKRATQTGILKGPPACWAQ
ncbi:MAG: hypothetical protein U0Y68_20640 [Blastocatellia bacterium]